MTAFDPETSTLDGGARSELIRRVSAKALETYKAALAKLRPEDERDRALELIHRGALLTTERQYALALQDLQEALVLATRLQDFELVRDAEINLNDVDQGQKNIDAAWSHLDRAQAAWDQSGRTRPSAGILVNRAILNRMRRDFAEGIRILDKLSSAHPPPDAETASVIAQQRGAIYVDAGNDELAEEAFRDAISIVEDMWSTSPMASFLEERWFPPVWITTAATWSSPTATSPRRCGLRSWLSVCNDLCRPSP